ncbi:MAG: AAA family ATPase, partial [Chloroflexota bacterium]
MKVRKLHIKDYKIFHDFEIDFTNNEQTQNLIVIAGINGSGKTTLLEFLHNFLLTGDTIGDGWIELQNDETDPPSIVRDDGKGSPFLEIGKLSYIFGTGTDEVTKAKDKITSFVDKLIYEHDKKSSEAYTETQKRLESIFYDFDLQIQFKQLDRNKEVYFTDSFGNELTISELSSGQQQLITKAFSLYLADFMKNSFILIDEPESSLHPTWQTRIASIYQNFA